MQVLKKHKFKSWIFDELKAQKEEAAQEVQLIPIHIIKPNPYQPRREFDQDSIEELACSIKSYGLIQPITVRRLYSGEYELVAGERRMRACSLAGMLKIPAMVTNLSDNDSALVALLENIQRCELSFIEEAEAYRNLLYRHGLTQEELAVRLGKNQSSVANKIRLLKLSSPVRELIRTNGLSERHARALLKLDNEEKQIEALGKICDEALNVKQSEELIENMLSAPCKKPVPGPRPVPVPIIRRRTASGTRLFTNTLRHAVDLMRRHGIYAETTEKEYDDRIEYIISVSKLNETVTSAK